MLSKYAHRDFSLDEICEIIAYYVVSKLSVKEIGALYNVSAATVTKRCQSYGVPPRWIVNPARMFNAAHSWRAVGQDYSKLIREGRVRDETPTRLGLHGDYPRNAPVKNSRYRRVA